MRNIFLDPSKDLEVHGKERRNELPALFSQGADDTVLRNNLDLEPNGHNSTTWLSKFSSASDVHFYH